MRVGDRLLLEGPSGGGKSTLASLLAGLRPPQSGLLLLRGLDRQTLGTRAWRRQAAAAPQFHENHVLTVNLLMGAAGHPLPRILRRLEHSAASSAWTIYSLECQPAFCKWWGKQAGSFRMASEAAFTSRAPCFNAPS